MTTDLSILEFFKSLTCWYWFGFAILLLIVEIVGCAGFLFWIGLSAALVGVVLLILPDLGWAWQCVIFGVGAILTSVLWWHHLSKQPPRQDNRYLNQRGKQYIGRTFTLSESMINGRGQIKVDDSQWRVEGENFQAGTVVKVVDVDGVILKVEKIK